MGGGRSGVFPGTRGADNYQQSIWDSSIRVRHRGPTFVNGEEGQVSGVSILGGFPDVKHTRKLVVLTGADVLEQCLLYRFGVITEKQLIEWIEYRLRSKRYSISQDLRICLKNGVTELKSTKVPNGKYDQTAFMVALEHFEHVLESL